MEKVKIKIRTQYKYHTTDGRYEAEVLLYLPVTQDGRIHPLLQSRDTLIFNERLISYWGNTVEEDGGEYRWRGFSLFAEDFQDLKRRVQAYVDEIVSMLRSVVEKNRSRLAIIPEGEELEIEL